MPAPHTAALFAAAALALLLIPGPAVLYIVTRSVTQGRRAGFVSVLGIHAGTLVHVAAAAFGLSAILVRSSAAFHAIKYAGAAYLIFLGIMKFRNAGSKSDAPPAPRESLGQIFRKGIAVSVLNPKSALFFFAFFPQFIDPTGNVVAQTLTLGFIFLIMGMTSDSMYAIAAGSAGNWIRSRRITEYVSGSVFIALGAITALSGRRAH